MFQNSFLKGKIEGLLHRQGSPELQYVSGYKAWLNARLNKGWFICDFPGRGALIFLESLSLTFSGLIRVVLIIAMVIPNCHGRGGSII